MSTTIRPELSDSNELRISKHRYYELKHFCLQYKEWNEQCYGLGYGERGISVLTVQNGHSYGDYYGDLATKRVEYKRRMELVEEAAKMADKGLSRYLMVAVTENRSYTYLQSKMNIPCGRNSFYQAYRKFFFLLDKTRN